MARGLQILLVMQIPYDLEFVENRPRVAVRALALHEPHGIVRRERAHDVFDVLLAWVHRLLNRLEKN
jgi:hypothetical protein